MTLPGIIHRRDALYPILHYLLPSSLVIRGTELSYLTTVTLKLKLKVPIVTNWKGVCLQNTSKSHLHHLKIWHLL